MSRKISVIIPNRNGAATIGGCLDSVFASSHANFEVVVVDDCSTDNSVEIIKQFPCRLVRLDKHSGASKARNEGANNSSGEILFFTDADCVLQNSTLSVVASSLPRENNRIVGGSYTKIARDDSFFSTFQSVFVNYSETKTNHPDYIATHAMAISADLFRKSGGFPEDFLPIIEDVEFSHRLRRSGAVLTMNPDILVQHVFGFNLLKSMRNAYRKSKYWTIYSLRNRDLLADSGTASAELKINVASYFLCLFFLILSLLSGKTVLLAIPALICVFNVFVNRKFLAAVMSTKGFLFSVGAISYYLGLYPLAVGAGGFSGMMHYLLFFRSRGPGS